jgi:hypothetical protein
MERLSTRVGITPDDVDRIVAVEDPALRNALITQCYHEISKAFVAATGPGANWCSFATWASKQAGVTIRSEDLREAIDRELDHAPAVRAAISLLAAAARLGGVRLAISEVRATVRRAVDPEATARRASDAVARGNRKVFEEIGKEFACFLDTGPHKPTSQQLVGEYIRRLRPGDPPHGQDLLRKAFGRYHTSFSASSGAATEARFLANLEIGLHEQARLQPEIAEALGAAVPDAVVLRKHLVEQLLPGRERWLSRAGTLVRRLVGRPDPVQRAIERAVAAVRGGVRSAITEHFMILDLPEIGALRLGRDLAGTIPESLSRPVDPELIAFLTRLDPTPDSLVGTGARDWADLMDRMHLIADLFRCHHETAALHTAPFTDDQVAALAAGRLPGGRL